MNTSLYDQMGGHDGIVALVTEFYRLMDTLPEAAGIRKTMLRYRHLPFWIGDSERDQWMLCMNRALSAMPWNETLQLDLSSAFKRVADHMRNAEQKMQMQSKKLKFIKESNGSHWVGDGFPVRNIFSYDDIAEEISPFLLLDYAGPRDFPPTPQAIQRRGVGEHPHRGFETVSIIYHGEVEHRDSAGGGGIIGPGDVQWMTAARGLVHSEFHGPNYRAQGGPFQMVQLWVNLPSRDKMTEPRYQSLTSSEIPRVELPGGAGWVRVIAGECLGARGPARTFTPMNVWDVSLKPGSPTGFEVTEGHTATFLVLEGRVKLGSAEVGEAELGEAQLAVLEREGTRFVLEALTPAKLLFMMGEPLNEPVVGYGPFVMNTEAEIRQAFRDYQSGKMGKLPQ